MHRSLKRTALGLLTVVAAAAACTKAPAVKIQPEIPALAMPLPPPRVVTPPEPEPEAPKEPPAEAPSTSERPRSPRRPPVTDQPRGESDSKEPAKPEMTPEPPPAPAPEPAPTLEIAPGTADVAEREIRQRLQRAAQDLGRVNYRALAAQAKIQYDTAKKFILLGEQAVKEHNLVYARTLADKAAQIATQLLPLR
jgi:outer membrane biosynthesis protein TonB